MNTRFVKRIFGVSAAITCVMLGVVMCVILRANPPATEPAKEQTLDLGGEVKLKLVLIPAGKFIMGAPATEFSPYKNEGPQHEVTISRPFYMGIYHVTQQQYQHIMGNNRSLFKDPDNPMEMVSWDDAVEFCKKVSQKTGKTVRLPTEAEWEYACRAGSTTRFSYGEDDKNFTQLGDYAWYAGNSDKKSHPVGLKKPNDWGLHEMHGNEWQWCADWFAPYTDAKAIDPEGPASGTHRIVRGGCWFAAGGRCRSAFRMAMTSNQRHNDIGFRVVVNSD